MERFIEVRHCYRIDEDYTDFLKFFSDYKDAFKFIDYWAEESKDHRAISLKSLGEFDKVKKGEVLESFKEHVSCFQEVEEEEEAGKIDDLEEYIEFSLGNYWRDYLIDGLTYHSDSLLDEYLEFLGFELYNFDGGACISAYSDEALAFDLWHGHNFYDLALVDEKGEVIDAVGMCYLPDGRDFTICVNDCFSLEPGEYGIISVDGAGDYFEGDKFKVIPTGYKVIAC